MAEARYYIVRDWEIYPNANKFNFYLQVYDENYIEVKDHEANDRNYGAEKWRRINAQRGRAIRRAEKAKLKLIFNIPAYLTIPFDKGR